MAVPRRRHLKKESGLFMTGAMYAAVAGLKAHMSALNVIGNNISNVNTAGYKATRYVFSEELYTSVRGGSNGTAQVGGRNPAQIGYGCSIGQIDLDMSTKNYSPTGRVTDCMIDGDGFFLVGDKNRSCLNQDEVQGFMLTRLGNFEFKADGYFCDGDGKVAYGYARIAKTQKVMVPILNEDGTESDQKKEVEVPVLDETGQPEYEICPVLTELRKPMCAKITEQKFNEDTQTMEEYVSYKIYYPKYDPEQKKVVDWTEDEIKEAFEYQYKEDAKKAGKANAEVPDYNVQRIDFQSISLDEKTGRISAITSDDQAVIVGYIGIGQVDNPNGVTHTDGHYYQAQDGAGELHIKSMGGAIAYIQPDPAEQNIMWREAKLEGGKWVPLEDDEDKNALEPGTVIKMMAFTTADGTVTDDKTQYTEPVTDAKLWDTDASVEIGSAGKTSLVGGGLETSGTDLATEISNMIMIQRGYQANTRIVTVTDSMLEELVNMKRG